MGSRRELGGDTGYRMDSPHPVENGSRHAMSEGKSRKGFRAFQERWVRMLWPVYLVEAEHHSTEQQLARETATPPI